MPTGLIADRWGRKASIAIGTLLYSVAMFLILTPALSPSFILGYVLWNSSMAFVSGADSALLYDSLKADGREAEAAKFAGRSTAIQLGSQGLAAVVGSALATVNITLCFSISGILAFGAAILILTVREAPRYSGEGEKPLEYWNNLREAIRIAARRPAVRAILLLSTTFSVVPLVVYYFLLQPYALAVGFPIAGLGVVVVLIQGTTVAASWVAHRIGRRFELRKIVTVNAVFLEMDGITISRQGLGQQLQLSGRGPDGHVRDLTRSATWRSADPSVATVDITFAYVSRLRILFRFGERRRFRCLG